MIISNEKRYHFYKEDTLFASKGRKVIKSSDNGRTWNKIFTVKPLSFLSYNQLFNRLTRNGIHHVIPLNKEIIVVLIKKRFLIYRNGKLINSIPVIKGSRPLRQSVLAKNNYLYFGDYWGNPNREIVNIYCVDIISGKIDIELSLPNTRHVHFIQEDKVEPFKFFIGTGDRDEECIFYHYNLNNKEYEVIGGGDQRWRAVSIVQKDNYIYWGTDCPYKQNYIFRYDRLERKIEKVRKIAGPAYYSCINKLGNLYIGTTIENRYEHKAVIYKSKDGSNWHDIQEWKKDIFHEKLFGYGQIEFIQGQENLEELFVNIIGLSSSVSR